MHFLINLWSPTAAWILSALSLYTAMQLIALIRSMPKRPIEINEAARTLELRYGIFSETSIYLDQIEHIEISRKPFGLIKLARTLSPLGTLDGHNVIITLKEENILNSLYGFEKKYKTLALFVDDKEVFVESINTLLQQDFTAG